jgi:hypothetical protein
MKSPRLFYVVGILLLLTSATAFSATHTVGSIGADFTSVQAAINGSAASDNISLLANNTFTESVNIDRILTIIGVDTSAKIHGSITINANSVTLQTFVVYGSSGDGISASGRSSLTFNSVVSRNNTGSGLQLTNCSTITLTDCIFSKNLDQGFNAVGGAGTYTLTRVHADTNGTGINGSGINLDGMSTVTLTDLSANGNHHHGLSVGDGATGVTISGGTFTGNGTAGDATTGGGINFIASGHTTTSGITLSGIVNSSNNTTAGIYIFSDNATVNAINTVAIGATGSITLSNNGSSNETYSGGAGVLVYGIVSGVTIANTTFTKGAAPGGGLLNLGDGTQAGSPSGTQVAGSTFNDYTSAYPAVTLTDGRGHSSPSATNDVAATNCTFRFPVAVKVFLQGPFAGPAMNTLLGANIPLPQPYSGAPFSYSGTEHPLSIPTGTVDWVLLQLRATYNGAAVAQRAAFLKSDGTILDTNGVANVSLTETLSSGYTISNYIIIKHRNHLAIMSASAQTLPNDASAYDFTTAQAKAYGTNPMAALTGSVFGMFAGDADQDGQITSSDFDVWLPNARSALNGYATTDIDLDSQVTSSDFDIWLPNARSAVSTQVP